jgi:hypothetical protein
MKSFFRAAAVAWTVGATLLFVSYHPSAQEGPVLDEPQIVSRDYDVRLLVQSELWNAPRTGAIGDVLAPDRLFFAGGDHADDEWSLRDSGDEARCWKTAEYLGSELQDLLQEADADQNFSFDYSRDKLNVSADEATHTVVKWALDALNEVARARLSMVVYRLKDDAPLTAPALARGEVQGWTKGARFVGTFAGGLAEPFVLQQTQHRSYVADYDVSLATEASIAEPRVNDLHTGEEFVLGAVSLSDGRLWVQGWHAAMKLHQMRSAATDAGTIELPEVSYSFAPVSAVIENGGAALIDAGPAGKFLVRAECDRVVRNHELKLPDGETLRLVNCVGSMRGHGLGGFWLMRPTSSALMEDSMFPQVILEDIEDGPYLDAAMRLSDQLDSAPFQLRALGPYLAVLIPSGDELLEEDRAYRDDFVARIDAIPAAPEVVGVRITAFEVKDDAALPAGVLNGRPSAADVAELKALAGGKALFDRLSMNLLRQQVDQFEVKLATHLRDYDSHSATGVTALDPQVGTLVLGEQIRWQARSAEDGRLRLEVRSGITVGGEQFEKVAVGNDGLTVERSHSALTQARLSDELAAGERMSCVSPGAGADGRLVVIVVERLK